MGKTGTVKTGESPTGDLEGTGSQFVIGGYQLRVTDVTLTATTLTLGIVARTQRNREILRELDNDAGDFRERARADGTIDGLDTAGGSNTFTVSPPLELRPPRVDREWVVEDVTRERTSADTQALLAEVVFVATEAREPITTYSNFDDFSATGQGKTGEFRTGSGGIDASNITTALWEFDFFRGSIFTERVQIQDQAATTTVQVIMTPEQAELFETVTPATAGAVVTPVPDGKTFARDTTPQARQTVRIRPPASAADPALTEDEYVITNWESIGREGDAFRVVFDVTTRFD